MAWSTCIGDSGLAAGVVGLAAGATAGWIGVGGEGTGADGMTVREGGEKNWGGS